MKQKKFIDFKVATLLAFSISVCAFVRNVFLSLNSPLSYNSFWQELLFLFFLSLSILFQLWNIKLFSYIDKQGYPSLFFMRIHTVLLIIDSLIAIFILFALGQMFAWGKILIFHRPYLRLFIFLFTIIFLTTNSTTIISSLRLRNYLRKQRDYIEQELLANIGKL